MELPPGSVVHITPAFFGSIHKQSESNQLIVPPVSVLVRHNVAGCKEFHSEVEGQRSTSRSSPDRTGKLSCHDSLYDSAYIAGQRAYSVLFKNKE